MSPFKPKPTRASGAELAARIGEVADGVRLGEGVPVAPAPAMPLQPVPELPMPLPAAGQGDVPQKKLSAAQRAKTESPRSVKTDAEPVLQVNFRCSIEMFRLLTRGVEAMGPLGSQRRFIAKLMKDAGYEVPKADIDPPVSRRIFS